MVDAEEMIHATQHFGRTVIEPLADVVGRVDKDHPSPILARRRIAK
jgi:hypothetical protein